MDKKSRKLLIECGQMAWQEISPVIFGSMFQSVMDKEKRRAIGAHYTSEENIIKLVRPLFLDDLQQEFERICGLKVGKGKALHDFHAKIADLGFLDPACGCGNFLIVAYRELRELELGILVELARMEKAQANMVVDVSLLTRVSISQFYGIELEEFPVEIARVSLWLMEHVMNLKLGKQFGQVVASIPLKHTPGIVCANALTTPWERVVAPEKLDFILGNPPFVGSSNMTKEQKSQLLCVFKNRNKAGKLDFVTAWYEKASLYMAMNKQIAAAFVSTNSICQGEQVEPLWGNLINRGINIKFAHKTFQWSNEAKRNAAVYCIILGFGYNQTKNNSLFIYPNIKSAPYKEICNNINPYLISTKNLIIKAHNTSISATLPMVRGNQPTDGGNLIIEDKDYEQFVQKEPLAKPYIKKLIGAEELLHSKQRYCLWLPDAPKEILALPLVRERIQKCKEMRLNSRDAGCRSLAVRPHEFRDLNNPDTALVIPSVSSERRKYIPLGLISPLNHRLGRCDPKRLYRCRG